MAESASLDQTEEPQNSGSAQLSLPYVHKICPEGIALDFLASTLFHVVTKEGTDYKQKIPDFNESTNTKCFLQ